MRSTRSLSALIIATVLAVAATLLVGSATSSAHPVKEPRTPRGADSTTDGSPDSTTDSAGDSTTDRRMKRFPTGRTAGVPAGWSPKRTVHGSLTISKPGAVLENVRILNGDLVIEASGVTVRRVEIVGGVINNFQGDCVRDLKVQRTTIRRAPGQATSGDFPSLGAGGYLARRVKIAGLSEGFRVGGKRECGGVRIVNSYARIVSPTICGDWHGDALQGYDGGRLVVRNTVLKLIERDDCGGTAPFFYPAGQGNSSVEIDGLIVKGGGYAFRLGMPGKVRNLHIVRGSYGYGPIDVNCSAVNSWDADIVDIHKGGQPLRLRGQRCNTDAGY